MKLLVFFGIITCGCITADSISRKERSEDDTCGVPAIIPNAPRAVDTQTDDDRIVGGNQAIPHSWPWQIRMFVCDDNGEKCQDWCGGSIINRYEIATAAHCLEFGKTPANRLKIRLGAHNLDKWTKGEQMLNVTNYEAGPDMDTDMAVLTLNSPIRYTDHISPVCLPTVTLNPGTVCYVTGYGEFDRKGSPQSRILRQAPLSILDDQSCTAKKPGLDPAKEICAWWRHGTSSCFGDSGGPFVCLVNGKWELHGISSYIMSEVCGDQPSGYVRVSAYSDWFSKAR